VPASTRLADEAAASECDEDDATSITQALRQTAGLTAASAARPAETATPVDVSRGGGRPPPASGQVAHLQRLLEDLLEVSKQASNPTSAASLAVSLAAAADLSSQALTMVQSTGTSSLADRERATSSVVESYVGLRLWERETKRRGRRIGAAVAVVVLVFVVYAVTSIVSQACRP